MPRGQIMALASGMLALVVLLALTIRLLDLQRSESQPRASATTPCIEPPVKRFGGNEPPGFRVTRLLPDGSAQTTEYQRGGGYRTAICDRRGRVLRGQEVALLRFNDGSAIPAVTHSLRRKPNGKLSGAFASYVLTERLRRQLQREPARLLAPLRPPT